MTLKIPEPFEQTGIVMTKKSGKMVLVIPALASVLFGQPTTKQALQMALGVNSKQMVSYQWMQRTTVSRKGHSLDPTVDEIRLDATGQVQRISVVKPEEKRMGPLRAKKAAEIRESVQEVMQLARRYANPQQLNQVIQAGEIWEGQNGLRVQARAVILPLDEMVMLVDNTSYLTTRIEIKTQHDGSPVTIAIDYRQLPNGPSMMTRMTVQIPNEEVVVSVDSFDFVRVKPRAS